MANPDYKPHIDLEAQVVEYLQTLGFVSHAAPYHAVMPPNVKEVLQNRWSFTALYVRARADRIAIHRTVKNIEFEYELKTHENKMYGDLTLEALPLIHHLLKAQAGVKCLYAFSVNGQEGGFWVHNRPPIRVAMYPQRLEWQPLKSVLEPLMQSLLLPRDGVKSPSRVGGSGDPFVIIDQSVIATLPHWSILVRELLPIDSAP